MQITADKIFEVTNVPSLSAMQGSSSSSLMDQIASLTKQVEVLTSKFSKFSGNRSRSPFKKAHQNNSHSLSSEKDTRKSQKTRSKSQVAKYPRCYYHYRYGDKAQKCEEPCDFNTKN